VTASCPSCGAQIEFKSELAPYRVCDYCRAVVVRKDARLDVFGRVAALPVDMSVLQVGTYGRYDGKAFEVRGRIRREYDGGRWNEWYILYDSGEVAWLAEAMGQFSMLRQAEWPGPGIPSWNALKVGTIFTFGNLAIQAIDKRPVTFVGYEGELGFAPEVGARQLNIDFVISDGTTGTLEYGDETDTEPDFYLGKTIPIEALGLKNLRKLDGWKLPATV